MYASCLGLFRKGKTCIIANCRRIDLVICRHCKEGKTLSYSQINTVSYLVHFLYINQ